MTSGFGFDSPFDDLINQFFGGRDPFSLLGARQTTAPSMQRVDLSRSLSAEARALISRAAAQAAQWGNGDVDAEHLLWAATQEPATRTLLEQAGVDVAALASQLEQAVPHGEPAPQGEGCR